MKKLLAGALALSLLAGSAAIAQPYGQDHHDNRADQGDNRGNQHDNSNDHRDNRHHWSRGQRLPAAYYRDSGHYVDYRSHHLRAPPRGYRWVQADNDYALVAITTGLIASIIAHN